MCLYSLKNEKHNISFVSKANYLLALVEIAVNAWSMVSRVSFSGQDTTFNKGVLFRAIKQRSLRQRFTTSDCTML